MAITKLKNLNNPDIYQRCIDFINDYNKRPKHLRPDQIGVMYKISIEIGQPLKNKKCAVCLSKTLTHIRYYISLYEQNNPTFNIKENEPEAIDRGNDTSNNITEIIQTDNLSKRRRKNRIDNVENNNNRD